MSVGQQAEMEPRPSCLFVLPWSLKHLGGVNEVVKSLLRHMESDPVLAPLLLVTSGAHVDAAWDSLQSHRTIYREMPPPFEPSRPLRSVLSFIVKLPFRLLSLHRLLRESSVRIVNPHYPSLGALHFVLLRALGLYKGHLVLSFHLGDVDLAARTGGLERLLWGALLRAASLIVTPSDSLRDELLKLEPLCRDRLATINNGVDVELFDRADLECPGFPPSAAAGPAIVSSAAFEERKGQDVLIRALPLVRERVPGAVLMLVGFGSAYLSEIRRLIRSLSLEHCVSLVENLSHEHVPARLAQARVFAHASRSESFCIALLEAGAARLPVVAARIPGVSEIITDGVTGRLVPMDDVGAFAAAISELLENPEEARRLGGNLRAHVEKNLTWKHHWARYRNAYLATLTARNPD